MSDSIPDPYLAETGFSLDEWDVENIDDDAQLEGEDDDAQLEGEEVEDEIDI